jgi:hypothetical protein
MLYKIHVSVTRESTWDCSRNNWKGKLTVLQLFLIALGYLKSTEQGSKSGSVHLTLRVYNFVACSKERGTVLPVLAHSIAADFVTWLHSTYLQTLIVFKWVTLLPHNREISRLFCPTFLSLSLVVPDAEYEAKVFSMKSWSAIWRMGSKIYSLSLQTGYKQNTTR